jgi:hypothetical protein
MKLYQEILSRQASRRRNWARNLVDLALASVIVAVIGGLLFATILWLGTR